MPVRRHPVAVSPIRDPLAQLPLDMELVKRLKATYAMVRERDTMLAEIFYARLFAAAPHLRPLFRSEPAVQAWKLMEALDAVVRNLESPSENAAAIAALGRRHAGYGARPEHYELVGDLLVESMREALGRKAEDAALGEWRMALRLISDQMILAAGRAQDAAGMATS